MEGIKENTTKNIIDQDDVIKPPKVGDIVEGTVSGKGRASLYLDLGGFGGGIIFGKEFLDAKTRLKHLKVGERLLVKVVDLENEEGYIELSLTKAGQDLAWEEISSAKDKDEMIKVKITGANKGGLLAEISGIPAFLPVSQLSSANYPKVEGGDTQKILKSLQKFVGEEMEVKVFDYDKRAEKLILSEKAKESKKIKEILESYNVGDIVEGEITGVVDFGAFIKFPNDKDESEKLEGLIHISELDWQLIEDPSKVIKVGDKVQAKVIDISNGKVSLSIKALKQDPWENIGEKYNKDDVVKGEVVKFNPFGAFIKLSPEIQGLCHVSEFASREKMEQMLRTGETYDFQIISIEPSDHRMSLKLKEKKEKKEKEEIKEEVEK